MQWQELGAESHGSFPQPGLDVSHHPVPQHPPSPHRQPQPIFDQKYKEHLSRYLLQSSHPSQAQYHEINPPLLESHREFHQPCLHASQPSADMLKSRNLEGTGQATRQASAQNSRVLFKTYSALMLNDGGDDGQESVQTNHRLDEGPYDRPLVLDERIAYERCDATPSFLTANTPQMHG